jgi:hypothetical protein
MRYHLLLIITAFLLASCATEVLPNIVVEENVPANNNMMLPTPTLPPEASSTKIVTLTTTPSPRPTLTPTKTITLTPEFTATPAFTATPTETLIPPVEIPTEITNAPARQTWIGEPTYSADSQPGSRFELTYDPDLWALTPNQFEQLVLAHRTIEYCTIAPYVGRGVPMNYDVQRETRVIGAISYEVSLVSENGVPQFMTYTGGDGVILTAFQLTFVNPREACAADAEIIFAALRSITPEPSATP